MNAIGCYQNHPVSHRQMLQDIELPTPDLIEAHRLVEAANMIGKVVVTNRQSVF